MQNALRPMSDPMLSLPAAPVAPRPGQPPRRAQAAPNLLTMLKALQRRWLLALTLGLLAGGSVAGAAWVGMQPKFTVSSLLYVKASEPRVLGQEGGGGPQFALYQQSQAGLVKGRLVLNAA